MVSDTRPAPPCTTLHHPAPPSTLHLLPPPCTSLHPPPSLAVAPPPIPGCRTPVITDNPISRHLGRAVKRPEVTGRKVIASPAPDSDTLNFRNRQFPLTPTKCWNSAAEQKTEETKETSTELANSRVCQISYLQVSLRRRHLQTCFTQDAASAASLHKSAGGVS